MNKTLRRWSRPARHWWRYTPREEFWLVVMCAGAALVAVAIVAAFILL
jgi:hypothetical protein